MQHNWYNDFFFSASINGFGDKEAGTAKSMIKMEVRPVHESDCCVQMNVLITKKITEMLPNVEVHVDQYSHLKNILLADPECNKPVPIDLSMGSDYWGQFALNGVIKAGPGVPYAHQPELGWVVNRFSSMRSRSMN